MVVLAMACTALAVLLDSGRASPFSITAVALVALAGLPLLFLPSPHAFQTAALVCAVPALYFGVLGSFFVGDGRALPTGVVLLVAGLTRKSWRPRLSVLLGMTIAILAAATGWIVLTRFP